VMWRGVYLIVHDVLFVSCGHWLFVFCSLWINASPASIPS
jgi:hypothetical protein